jgi:hypothetical protein
MEGIMEDNVITEALCEARMETLKVTLDGIRRDAADSREGVGKIIRTLTEGNGKEALTATISRNDMYIQKLEDNHILDVIAAAKKLAENTEKDKANRRAMLLWGIGIASGWALTLVKLFWPAG